MTTVVKWREICPLYEGEWGGDVSHVVWCGAGNHVRFAAYCAHYYIIIYNMYKGPSTYETALRTNNVHVDVTIKGYIMKNSINSFWWL